MLPNEEGIFFDEPAEVYHADMRHETPSLSGSLAKILIEKTPRHCWWSCQRLNPRYEPEFKSIWDRGSAVHALLLNSGAEVERIDAKDWRTKAAKDARDAARLNGKVPVLAHEHDEIMTALEMILPQIDGLQEGDIFRRGSPEVVMRWRDEFLAEDGRTLSVWCRSRVDWFNPSVENAVDLKSMTGSAEPIAWCRYRMWDIGAPYQAAFYRRGLRRLAQLGKLTAYDPDFLFLLVESKPPFGISMVHVPSDIRRRGADPTAGEQVMRAMTLWHDCLDQGVWPGYSGYVHIAEGAKALPQPKWSEQKEQVHDWGGHVSSDDIARTL